MREFGERSGMCEKQVNQGGENCCCCFLFADVRKR